MLLMSGEAMVAVNEPESEPYVAVMMEEPALRPVMRPVELTVATAVLLEVQVAELVTSVGVPTRLVSTARNCVVVPAVSAPLPDEMVMTPA